MSNYNEDTDSYEERIIEEEDEGDGEEEVIIEVDSSEATEDTKPPSPDFPKQGPSKKELSKSVKEKIAKVSAELGAVMENPTTQEEKEIAKKISAKFDDDIAQFTAVIQQIKSKIELAPIKAKEQIEKVPEDKDFVEDKLKNMLAKFNQELSSAQEFVSNLQKKNGDSVTAFIMRYVGIVKNAPDKAAPGSFKINYSVNETAEMAIDILQNCRFGI